MVLAFKISQRQLTEQRSLRSKIFEIERKEKATDGRLFFPYGITSKNSNQVNCFKNFLPSSLKRQPQLLLSQSNTRRIFLRAERSHCERSLI